MPDCPNSHILSSATHKKPPNAPSTLGSPKLLHQPHCCDFPILHDTSAYIQQFPTILNEYCAQESNGKERKV